MHVCELRSLPDLVRRNATLFGDSPALVRSEISEGSAMSYAQLLHAMRRGASVFHARGLGDGDRVLLATESGPEWVGAFFATLEAGMIAVPVPPDAARNAVAAISAHAQAKAIVVSSRTQGVAANVEHSTIHVQVEELLSHDPAHSDSPPHGDPNRLAVLSFTSGSTQQPRAVELTHRNILANLDSLLRVRNIGRGDAILSMLPLAHMFELMCGLLGPLACGSRIVYANSLLPNRLVDALRSHRITHALGVPALVKALYEELVDELVAVGVVDVQHHHLPLPERSERIRLELSAADLCQIRAAARKRIGDTFHTFFVGGAAIDPAMADILDAVGVRMEVGYGLTEASPIVTVGFSSACPRGSVGQPLPGIDVRIGDNAEVLVRGPNVMNAYYENETATALALSEGWLRTGDYGRMDEDGFLFIDGRLKEVMVTATGESICPEDIELHYAHPLFAEWCVAALRAADGNDLPTLFVVPSSPDAAEAELQRAFRELRGAAPSKLRVERMILMSTPLPRTRLGKIRRCHLAERVQNSETDHE